MAGIINSIETDSSWKTRTFSEECKAFAAVIREDFKKPLGAIRRIREAVNYGDDNNE